MPRPGKNLSTIILLALAVGWSVLSGPAWGGPAAIKTDSQAEDPAADEVIVRVGERTITRSELDMRTKRTALQRRQKPSGRETAAAVDRLVEQALFAEEARAMGMDRDPRVRMVIEDTVDRLLANLYVRRHVMPAVQVSESEVADYYRAHKKEWRRQEMVRARHILLRVGPQATAQEVQAVEVRAREIRKRLEGGEDFVQLAKSLSEDTGTRGKGGDLGLFNRKGKVAAISDTAFAMKPGELSRPVRSSVGYHILQVTERRPAGINPLEAVAGEIRPRLLREKQREAAQAARQRLEKKYDLYVDASLRAAGTGDEK